MSFLRHLLGTLASPLVLALLLVLAAGFVYLLRRPRAVRGLLISAALVGYFGATGIVGDALLIPLESEYEPLVEDQAPAVRYIVVLGSGYSPRGRLPITATLDQDGLTRIVEGVRLAEHFPTAKLVVSGGAPPEDEPPAHGYATLARQLGIASERLVVLDPALNTGEEARTVARTLGNQRFILVTSAYHMPRAMRQMRLARLAPIPAPTEQLSYDFNILSWRAWLPSAAGLGRSERALHEYLGLAALAAHVG